MEIEILYKKCPHCGHWFSSSELISYTVFGNSDCWSDGYSDDWVSFDLRFVKCDHCDNFIWPEDCETISYIELNTYLRENQSEKNEKNILDFLKDYPDYDNNAPSRLQYPTCLDFDLDKMLLNDIHHLLEHNDFDLNKKIYLRIRLWQLYNNPVRFSDGVFKTHLKYAHGFKDYFDVSRFLKWKKTIKEGKAAFDTTKQNYDDNLRKLIPLLVEYEKTKGNESLAEDYSFTQIEAYRNLGNFSESKKLLDELDPIDIKHNELFINKSYKMIKQRRSEIFLIN